MRLRNRPTRRRVFLIHDPQSGRRWYALTIKSAVRKARRLKARYVLVTKPGQVIRGINHVMRGWVTWSTIIVPRKAEVKAIDLEVFPATTLALYEEPA